MTPPPMMAEPPKLMEKTIMVPCVPVCCNKLIGIIMVPMLHILTFHNPPPPLMAELPKLVVGTWYKVQFQLKTALNLCYRNYLTYFTLY